VPGGKFKLYQCTTGKYTDNIALGGIPDPVLDPFPPSPRDEEPVDPRMVPRENRLIVLTIDSVSREKFKRVMKETLRSLRSLRKEGHEVVGFERYHTVGLNTRQNMVPMMSGATNNRHFNPNHHKWLYHVAEDAGYRTMVAGDFCTGMEGNPYTIFPASYLNWVYMTTLRYPSRNAWPLKAMCKDLYLTLKEEMGLRRPCVFRNVANKKMRDIHIRGPTVMCAGDKPIYHHWLEYLDRFLVGTGKRFAHIHSLAYHHKFRAFFPDHDNAYSKALVRLAADDRNIIVFASDHGWHFDHDYLRSSNKELWHDHFGKNFTDIWRVFAHQKSPFAYLIFPKDWHGFQGSEGTKRRENLLKNGLRLTNHYDMYYTMNYLLTGYATSNTISAGMRQTLFDDLGDRTCEQIGVPAMSCACGHAKRKIGNEVNDLDRFWCEETSTIHHYWEEYGFCM